MLFPRVPPTSTVNDFGSTENVDSGREVVFQIALPERVGTAEAGDRKGHLRPNLRLGTLLALIAPWRTNGGNIVEIVLTHVQQGAPLAFG
jgi:hypothetical protein